MSRSLHGTQRPIAVRRSSIHGRGVFALAAIPKCSRVIEYVGERISHDEADGRYGEEHEDSPHTMLFAVDDETVIDATHKGNSSRWINHSCAPNCEAVNDEGSIFIEAIRGIRPGEEITYDYNLILDKRHTPALKRANPCLCGARRCRGTLLGAKR